METFVKVYQSSILFQVEMMKGKLEAYGIDSYIKNEFVNNLAVMPINQAYFLMVSKEEAEEAEQIIEEIEELSESDFSDF
ncbi:putative signal transducing protein [Elizabethkingia sp. JS20170427COW]|uniref:putative signal transducing protein n=1 Tax=Elizabethkingia sp. JS20170427COW TaxID=2583851 RepID=UPI001110D8E0|nr:DUF2007 domain-containing protein [Elizabethkingia sp. JS20170427COW]QCX52570.1 DUF2007 domain-containing protein [Elizabethkingia sp. JS20170427COW]